MYQAPATRIRTEASAHAGLESQAGNPNLRAGTEGSDAGPREAAPKARAPSRPPAGWAMAASNDVFNSGGTGARGKANGSFAATGR